jgi:hypothetical protein
LVGSGTLAAVAAGAAASASVISSVNRNAAAAAPKCMVAAAAGTAAAVAITGGMTLAAAAAAGAAASAASDSDASSAATTAAGKANPNRAAQPRAQKIILPIASATRLLTFLADRQLQRSFAHPLQNSSVLRARARNFLCSLTASKTSICVYFTKQALRRVLPWELASVRWYHLPAFSRAIGPRQLLVRARPRPPLPPFLLMAHLQSLSQPQVSPRVLPSVY